MSAKKKKQSKKKAGKGAAVAAEALETAPEAPGEAPETAPEAPKVAPEAAPETAPEAPEAAPGAPGVIPEPPAEPPGDRPAELEAEVADLNDKLLRSMAELENYRRRAEKERGDVAKYAISNFARDMLTIADNLRRALESATDDGADSTAENLAAGVELTERELLAAFERHGIQKIDAMGKPFDHDLHQAMFEVEDKDKPAGTVIEELQTGYVLKDRLLRPAMVGLAKGGPQPEAEAPTPKETPPQQTPNNGDGNGGDPGEDPKPGPHHIDTSV